MIDYQNPTVKVEWTSPDGTKRVVRHENGKVYPQRYFIGINGLGWQYEAVYRSYKSVAGAKRAF